MELINNLGNRKGLFVCPVCNTVVERDLYNGKSQKTCSKSCRSILTNTGNIDERSKRIIEQFKEAHGDTYIYDKVNYLALNKKVTITCGVHGDFEQTPKNHRKGSGCPECAQNTRSIKLRKLNTARAATLYYVYFPELSLYKLGVTCHLSSRFNGEIYKHELLWSKEYSTEVEAYYVESILLVDNRDIRYKGEPLLVRKGNSELLTNNLLDTLPSSVETIESSDEYKALRCE